ncbi:MAG: 16S rRNA pseudouridine(516) synthase [Neisseria sp.]|nr:16S rRNA pseudouridine(516) synthase [Neisseria sp.]
MDIIKYLQAQGIGSRKECRELVRDGRVLINGAVPAEHIDEHGVETLHINETAYGVMTLPYFYLALHKPENVETSHKPSHYPSVFSLLPANVQRLKIQAVGRLDADTTGVLIITNDGSFNHRLTAAKNQVPKTYRVTLKHPADDDLCTRLRAGVLLADEQETVAAAEAVLTDAHTLHMTITSGKYHQVKRMIAAAGNRVEKLHRTLFGQLTADDLPVGQWRRITPDEVW